MHTLSRHAGVALAVACAGSLAAPAPANTAEAAGTAVVAAVEQVCLRQIGGQGLQTASSTPAQNRDGWIQKLEGRGEVRVSPPSRANPHVCQASVSYAPGGQQAILGAIDAWAAAHNLQKTKTRDASKGADLQYWISAWSGTEGGGTTSVVFTEQAELDGRPTGGALSEAVLLVSRQ
jgi:hypothetical protein